MGVHMTSLKTAYGGLGGGCSVAAKSWVRTLRPDWSARPIVPSGGIWRPTFHSGTPTTARQRRSVAVGLEDPAVRRVGADERDDLFHEPVDDGLELEVARENLGCLDQRLLLAQALLVLAEEAGGVDRQAQLAGDGLGERDLARSPGCRLGPVQLEDADDMRSKTRIGVARVERAPRARKASGLPRQGSAISPAASTSAIATVRRSRAARFMAGRFGAPRRPPARPPARPTRRGPASALPALRAG